MRQTETEETREQGYIICTIAKAIPSSERGEEERETTWPRKTIRRKYCTMTDPNDDELPVRGR